jgi:hypothetical protein
VTVRLVEQLQPPKTFVEIGAGDGIENCTRVLAEMGWSGTWFDRHEPYRVTMDAAVEGFAGEVEARIEDVTIENVIWLLKESQVEREFGVLSIDVDGNDYWLWRELCTRAFKPWLCIIEAQIQVEGSYIMAYSRDYVWPGDDNVPGASIDSMTALGKDMGYTFVQKCPDYHSPNLFFVRDDLADHL